VALVAGVAMGVALTVVVTGPAPSPHATGATRYVARVPTAIGFTTRPPDLTAADIARYGEALGIQGEPEREEEYWEIADPLRSIVLQRAPGSWYALFTDSSVLVEPPSPETGLPLSTAEPAPSAIDAVVAARAVLIRAGALNGTWDSRVGEAAEMPAVCRPIATRYDCDMVRLATRSVVFTRTVGGRETTVQWEVLVGPHALILDAVGCVAIVAASHATSG